MVEVSIGLDRISEKEEVKEMNYPDLVDDRAEPKISIPIPIHSSLAGNDAKLNYIQKFLH